MKSFFDRLPHAFRELQLVTLCPADGKLPRKFKPVTVEPWQPEPRRERGRRKRDATIEQMEKINEGLHWESAGGHAPTWLRLGEAGTDEPLDLDNDLGCIDRRYEPDEFNDFNYFAAVEAQGVRSLMQPAISSADWSWRAPAARCRSCGAVTWIASIADGIRCLSNARHRKGCMCPPSRLEVELSCPS